MPTLVQFGAGNIGRGFIAPLFSASGWRVVFIDIDQPRIAALQERGSYQVSEVSNAGRHDREVSPVTGILANDPKAQEAIAQADLLSTAVGLGALPYLGENIARGLQLRQERNAGSSAQLDVLVCENGIQAPHMLSEAIAQYLPDGSDVSSLLGLVRTSIGRMIPPPPENADCLDIMVEPYASLPVEGPAFVGQIPQITGLKVIDDFDLIIKQKLYIHNASHAACAYLGHLKGYGTIPDCMTDADLVSLVSQALDPVLVALAQEHSDTSEQTRVIEQDHRALLNGLFERYQNKALSDGVSRVARDPWRKLAADDRLMGAARLAAKHRLQPVALAHCILQACRYQPENDEPKAEDWFALQSMGWRTQLQVVAHLDNKEPLMDTLITAERQQQAAEIIRRGGIALNDSEVATIEIADFGLGRYEQIGLAIHIYVNTKRVCAKELAMLPRMMCPEHLHPDVDGEPGKEETFRVRAGEVFIYTPGKHSDDDKAAALARIPEDKRDSVTVFHCHHLQTGDQLTLPPNTKHWFVAGDAGCVLSEFSTRSRDEADIFTDTTIQRVPDDA